MSDDKTFPAWVTEWDQENFRNADKMGLLVCHIVLDPNTGNVGVMTTFEDKEQLHELIQGFADRIQSGKHGEEAVEFEVFYQASAPDDG